MIFTRRKRSLYERYKRYLQNYDLEYFTYFLREYNTLVTTDEVTPISDVAFLNSWDTYFNDLYNVNIDSDAVSIEKLKNIIALREGETSSFCRKLRNIF